MRGGGRRVQVKPGTGIVVCRKVAQVDEERIRGEKVHRMQNA